MEKCPNKIVVCDLSCLVMPNGEIICKGRTLGMFKDYKSELTGV